MFIFNCLVVFIIIEVIDYFKRKNNFKMLIYWFLGFLNDKDSNFLGSFLFLDFVIWEFIRNIDMYFLRIDLEIMGDLGICNLNYCKCF